MTDTQAARELELFIDNTNTPDCYKRKIAIQENLLKKKKRSVYDSAKADKAFKYVADSCAKRYAREFDRPSSWNRIFTVPTRKLVARELTKDFESEYRAGAFGGAAATTAWVVGGLGAVAAAAIGFAIYRKRRKTNA